MGKSETTIGDICEWMDARYPPSLAATWDKVGLICGDRLQPVRRVFLSLDPTEQSIAEALAWGANLMITHHPLFFHPTSFVSTDTAKGRVLHSLIRGNCGLFNAHTNADAAPGGVADALAIAAGLTPQECRPLEPSAIDAKMGIGRVGKLAQPCTLGELAQHLGRQLPASAGGILVAGNLEAKVEQVAVSGGSGDSLLTLVTEANVDVYITADLRHHPALEHMEDGGPALIVPTHWASEWVWLPHLAQQLELMNAQVDWGIEVKVSKTITEPWSAYIASTDKGEKA